MNEFPNSVLNYNNKLHECVQVSGSDRTMFVDE